jgi:hypothetical protein
VSVAGWVSPVTTALGVVVLLALLATLMGTEAVRQRGDGPGPVILARASVGLGVILAVDIVARFALLTNGH